MKLLLDENLPPRLADVLQSEFSGSIHVHSCGLGSADDEAWIRGALRVIQEFIADPDETLLVLNRS